MLTNFEGNICFRVCKKTEHLGEKKSFLSDDFKMSNDFAHCYVFTETLKKTSKKINVIFLIFCYIFILYKILV